MDMSHLIPQNSSGDSVSVSSIRCFWTHFLRNCK